METRSSPSGLDAAQSMETTGSRNSQSRMENGAMEVSTPLTEQGTSADAAGRGFPLNDTPSPPMSM